MRFQNAHRAALAGLTRPVAVPDQYFTQVLDHFDVTGTDTWQQRFWVNSTLWKGGDAPVFFYIEGEGAGSGNSVVSGEHVELAAIYGALLVSLEHRGYGASIPTADLSTPNMRFISSHQALADIANFYDAYLAPTFSLSPANKLMTFGGSYPGALSAWARLRLPHIVHGAISSSSPVEASFDDQSYNDVVAASLSYPLVGGSPACLQATRDAFAAMDAAFLAGGATRAAMAAKLSSCTDLSAGVNDTMWAASNYGSFIQGTVQYNLEAGGATIESYCAALTAPGAVPIDAFAAVIAASQGGTCIDNSYADYLQQLRDTSVNKGAGGVGLRSWTWQCCTQFSYWQDCDSSSQCPLSRAFMTLDSNTQQCADAFGEGVGNLASNVARTRFTNAYTGGSNIQSSNIIFVNGNVDPWHALSVTDTQGSRNGPAVTAVLINGTAHCSEWGGAARRGGGLGLWPNRLLSFTHTHLTHTLARREYVLFQGH